MRYVHLYFSFVVLLQVWLISGVINDSYLHYIPSQSTNPSTLEVLHETSKWERSLFTPTHAVKLSESVYVIVDCWHNRLLYNNALKSPIADWKTLDANIGKPHSFAYDTSTNIGLSEDNVGNQVVAYRYLGRKFVDAVFERVGSFSMEGLIAPHRVQFSKNYLPTPAGKQGSHGSFFALFKVNHDDHRVVKNMQWQNYHAIMQLTPFRADTSKEASYSLEVTAVHYFSFLGDVYSRSFTIHNGLFYFTTTTGLIVVAMLEATNGVHREGSGSTPNFFSPKSVFDVSSRDGKSGTQDVSVLQQDGMFEVASLSGIAAGREVTSHRVPSETLEQLRGMHSALRFAVLHTLRTNKESSYAERINDIFVSPAYGAVYVSFTHVQGFENTRGLPGGVCVVPPQYVLAPYRTTGPRSRTDAIPPESINSPLEQQQTQKQVQEQEQDTVPWTFSCVDVTAHLGLLGTPYYLSSFDDKIFVPEITEASGLVSFSESVLRPGAGAANTSGDESPLFSINNQSRHFGPWVATEVYFIRKFNY
jgi:hypothetical protein